MDTAKIEQRKAKTAAWFESLRDRLVAAFETLEIELPAAAPMSDRTAGPFERTSWQRTDHSGAPGGGGVMAMLHGRVYCPGCGQSWRLENIQACTGCSRYTCYECARLDHRVVHAGEHRSGADGPSAQDTRSGAVDLRRVVSK